MSPVPAESELYDEETTGALALVRAAIRAADAKLAEELVVLDVAAELSVIDYFVITSGRNVRQVATIAEEIEVAARRETGRSPLRIEGQRDATWILMDYGDVVFHVFLDETREYYDLEHLWSAVPRVNTAELLAPAERA